MNLQIIGPTDPLDGDPLYWSNADGWVSRETADVYAAAEGNLPIGGHWVDTNDDRPLCGCGHPAHWRECRGKTIGVISGDPITCECRHRGPSGD